MPDWKGCGGGVAGEEYMREEFPEQAPNETTHMKCFARGSQTVTLHCIEIEELAFPELAKPLRAEEFMKTERERFEEAKMRALVSQRGARGKGKTVKLSKKARRAKVKRRLVKKKKKAEMSDFRKEIQARYEDGYSLRQLIKSLIPEIGTEIKVSDAEITKAMSAAQVVAFLLV